MDQEGVIQFVNEQMEDPSCRITKVRHSEGN